MFTLRAPKSWRAGMRQRFWRIKPSDRTSVPLTHDRIYILPSGRGWCFMLTLVLMLLTSMNYGLSLGYALTFLFGGLMHAAMLHTYRNLSKLIIEALPQEDAEPTAFAGESIIFRLALRNATTYARYGVCIQGNSSNTCSCDVAAGDQRTVDIALPTKRRGPISLGRITIDTRYPLGLWRAWAYVHFPLNGTVYPAPEIGAPTPPSFGQGSGRSVAGQGDEEFSELRGYQPGDALPRVAWKIAARGLGLFTKEFAGAGSSDAKLAWSLTPAKFDTEKRLSRLTAWILLAEQRSARYTLEIPGASLPLSRGAAHRRRALSLLARHGLEHQDAAR